MDFTMRGALLIACTLDAAFAEPLNAAHPVVQALARVDAIRNCDPNHHVVHRWLLE
jgi:cobalamin biosynthesis protein CobD/CbiB